MVIDLLLLFYPYIFIFDLIDLIELLFLMIYVILFDNSLVYFYVNFYSCRLY